MNVNNDMAAKETTSNPLFDYSGWHHQELVERLDLNRYGMLFAVLGSFLFSSYFLIAFYAGGSIDPSNWSVEDMANASASLFVVLTITLALMFMYMTGGRTRFLWIAKAVLVGFALFTEISQTMNREDASVKARSQESPVYQALLDNIRVNSNQTQLSANQHQLAQARGELTRVQGIVCRQNSEVQRLNCLNRKDGLVRKAQGVVDQYQTLVREEQQLHQATLTATIQQAREAEFNPNQHQSIIRFISHNLGLNYNTANALVALVLIGAFEFSFWFFGTNHASMMAELRRQRRNRRGQLLEGVEQHASIITNTEPSQQVQKESHSHHNNVIDPYTMKAALIEGFESLFIKITTAEAKPLQNHIIKHQHFKNNPHQIVAILDLMHRLHWIEETPKEVIGKYQLPSKHSRLDIDLPLNQMEAEHYAQRIIKQAEQGMTLNVAVA